MSCRVLKRDLEYAMMDELVEKCKSKNINEIYGYYYPTTKNSMVSDFYDRQGFELINKDRASKTQNEDLSKLQNNYRCPYCHSNKINKNGTAHKTLPQFICRNCHKTYTIRTNTIFYYSKKDINIWREYIELFSQGLSLRKIVRIIARVS